NTLQQQPFAVPASPFEASQPVSAQSHLDIRTSQNIELPLASSAAINARVRSVESRIAAHSAQNPGSAGFTTLTHEEFPHLSVRIRQHGGSSTAPGVKKEKDSKSDPDAWCDPTVTSWTGYIDTIDGKSLWFQAFESRSNPEKDPLLLWTNGGPGCSSAVGLFQELGPCSVPLRNGAMPQGPPINGTKWNPHSWNSESSIIFIDQPVGVGFSYTRYGVHTYDADQGAVDVYAFLRIFFSAFPKFANSDFTMTGESYGGRYLPRYASEIVDRNQAYVQKAARAGEALDKSKIINLKSVAIGNGLTAMAKQIGGYYDLYNIEDGCKAGLGENLCYEVMADIKAYLDRPDVRKLIGAAPVEQIGNFSSCNHEVGMGFGLAGDGLVDNTGYVSGLLERGIKILIYIGTLDWICNWVGNKKWLFEMEWSGKEKFLAAKNYQWVVDGKEAGETQSAAGLTWATVLGAGHMVPYDKPVESKNMLYRWLNGEAL
ncbi:hypothetical protein OC846_000836, partial [Tilletia horrida]